MTFLKQLFCWHQNHSSLTRREGNRMFVECTGCGRQSPGVSMGGFKYNPARTRVFDNPLLVYFDMEEIERRVYYATGYTYEDLKSMHPTVPLKPDIPTYCHHCDDWCSGAHLGLGKHAK